MLLHTLIDWMRTEEAEGESRKVNHSLFVCLLFVCFFLLFDCLFFVCLLFVCCLLFDITLFFVCLIVFFCVLFVVSLLVCYCLFVVFCRSVLRRQRGSRGSSTIVCLLHNICAL